MRRTCVRLADLASRPKPTTTHPVLNQSSLFAGNNFDADPALRDAFRYYVGANSKLGSENLSAYGAWAGSENTTRLARLANENTPKIRNFDRNGRRIDVVDYHPAYHEIYGHATRSEVPSFAWRNAHVEGAHMTRALLSMLHYQAESGSSCPLTMTFAAIPALRTSPEAFSTWIEKGIHPSYDGADKPVSEKSGAVFGMSMTEKAGGSDVRSNTTTARPLGDSFTTSAGSPFLLTGHKWFTSAPMCDAFLTLAYTDVPATASASDSKPVKSEKALSCFLVPRWLPNGERNTGFRVVRLKEKLGDKSNASSEVEYDNAVGYLLGPVGRGVPTILEMVVHTRLDCALGSAGLMRHALRNTAAYCRGRKAFGMVLSEAPGMVQLLADLSVESEAATWMSLHMAKSFDRCLLDPTNTTEQAFRRLAVAVTKFFVCKQTPGVVYEALEGIGGNGYVEEWDFARWFRQSPLNSVWEGSGNVIAMDIQRTINKEPLALRAFFDHLKTSRGENKLLDEYIDRIQTYDATDPQYARFFAESFALALQGHCLAVASKELGDPSLRATFDFWCDTRLAPSQSGGAHSRRSVYGSGLPRDANRAQAKLIVERLTRHL